MTFHAGRDRRTSQKGPAGSSHPAGQNTNPPEVSPVSSVPNTNAAHCCYIDPASGTDCGAGAEYKILDLEDSDPYLCETEACTDHVGAMLGHAGKGNWRDGMTERWEVMPI
jgi:hypothetical protein